MSDRQALINAALAHPDEDTPRLVLADWLDEHAGELPPEERAPVAAQAELLRLGGEQARTTQDTPAADRLRARVNRLQDEHAGSLAAAVPAFTRGWMRLSRGLPTKLEITGTQILKHAKKLRPSVRYDALRLRNADGRLRGIVDAGLLAGVRELDLSFNSTTDDELIYLFRSPDLASLRALDLSHIRFGDAAAEALASSPHLTGLRRLNVWWSNPGTGRALTSQTCTLTNLEELHIGNSGLDPSTVEAIVERPHAANLRSLELSYNALGPAGGAVLRHAELLSGLRRLSLWGCGLEDAGAAELAGSPHMAKLEYLGLHSNGVTNAGAAALGRGACAESLVALELSSNRIGDGGLMGLLAGGRFGRLEKLGVGGYSSSPNELAPRDVRALAESPVAAALVELDLSGNESLGAELPRVLAAAGFARLEVLSLSRCGLGTDGAVALAAARNLGALRSLNLMRNDIGPEAGAALAAAPWMATLERLHLRFNHLGRAVEHFLACPRLDALAALTLDGNRVPRAVREQLKARLGNRVTT